MHLPGPLLSFCLVHKRHGQFIRTLNNTRKWLLQWHPLSNISSSSTDNMLQKYRLKPSKHIKGVLYLQHERKEQRCYCSVHFRLRIFPLLALEFCHRAILFASFMESAHRLSRMLSCMVIWELSSTIKLSSWVHNPYLHSLTFLKLLNAWTCYFHFPPKGD